MSKFYWERKAAVTAMVATMAFGLAGCGPTIQERIVYQDRLVYPADALIRDCEITPPPAKEDYLRKESDPIKTAEERERMLKDFGKAQTNNLVECNVRLKAVRKEKADLQQKLAAPKPPAKE